MAFFGLFGKKTPPAPAAPAEAGPVVDSVTLARPPALVIAGKALLVAGVGYLLQQIATVGVDATPLVVLPAPYKFAISLAAPTLLAYFLPQPQAKK